MSVAEYIRELYDLESAALAAAIAERELREERERAPNAPREKA